MLFVWLRCSCAISRRRPRVDFCAWGAAVIPSVRMPWRHRRGALSELALGTLCAQLSHRCVSASALACVTSLGLPRTIGDCAAHSLQDRILETLAVVSTWRFVLCRAVGVPCGPRTSSQGLDRPRRRLSHPRPAPPPEVVYGRREVRSSRSSPDNGRSGLGLGRCYARAVVVQGCRHGSGSGRASCDAGWDRVGQRGQEQTQLIGLLAPMQERSTLEEDP